MNTSEKKLSLLLKMIAVISALIGIIMSASLGQDSFMGGTHVFMFFTIQSNIAILLIEGYGAIAMLRNKPLSNLFYLIQFVGTVSITLTGMVFCFVLAPTLGNYAWGFSNVLTHVVVPLAAVIGFVELTREGQLTAAGTYKPFAVYITVACIYFAMCFPLTQWSRSLERKLDVAR